MADVINVGKKAQDVRKSVTLLPYSKVIINVEKLDEDTVISYVAGDDSGETLEMSCPWGTQEMANNLLAKIQGYQYQPYNVTGAIVDPAAEMGDAVQANGVYGGIYQQDSTFGHTYYSDFSAPQDEQLDHEYTYESPIERKLARQSASTRATFSILHDNIEARVTKKGGDIEEESFAWRLLSNEFALYSGTKKVFSCVKTGITVDGEIKARSGYIGSDSQGFVINSKNIHNGMTAYDDTEHDGVYLGTDGIGLGKANFTVYKDGTMKAKKGVIGSDTSAWNIGSKSIYNGLSSFSGTDEGTYVGIDGIALYKDDKNNIKLQRSTGRLTVLSGMTSRDDTTNTTGMYFGYDGIALGGGKFKVTNTGSVTAKDASLTGSVVAKSGRIGADSDGNNGFEITTNAIKNGKTSYSETTNDGVYIGTTGIGLGKGVFYVTNVGKLHCTDVDIEGKVKATSGEFSGELKSATGTFKGELSAATGTFKGELSAATGTFKGELSAATGSFTGAITATSGSIGSGNNPWDIGNSGIYRGKSSYGSTDSGIFIGNSGISMGAGKAKTIDPSTGQVLEWEYTAPFKVDSSGNLTAYSGTFMGTIYASKLTFTNPDGTTSTISGENITDGTIKTGKINDSAITSAKINDSAITSAKISDSAVTEGKINSGAVTEGKIGGGAVTSGKIGSKAVSKAKTADGVQTSLDKGDAAYAAVTSVTAGTITCNFISTRSLRANTMAIGEGSSNFHSIGWKTVVTSVNFTDKKVETVDCVGY